MGIRAATVDGEVWPLARIDWSSRWFVLGLAMDRKRKTPFAGAADVLAHSEAAAYHLVAVRAACAKGDKMAARRALRQAIAELELARAMLRIGIE